MEILGKRILSNTSLNKGMAFTKEERKELALDGLIPTNIESINLQIQRIKQQLKSKITDIEKYLYLQQLFAENYTLFFALVMSDPDYYIPIVYDPTIADACLSYSNNYFKPQGMYLNKNMKGNIANILKNWPVKKIRFICITSGGRILGLGDIGANGAPIPIGKLQLYTACAGVPPDVLLPIHLDIGTTNTKLKENPLYIGLREGPLPEQEIDELVDEFIQAATEVFPGVCIHFEDWNGNDAIRLLSRYKQTNLVFNDDIQGTSSIALAGLTTAMQIVHQNLKNQRILMAGAGSAGIGIANMLVTAMQMEGLTLEQARKNIILYDINGLIESTRSDLNPSQQIYAQDLTPTKDLIKVIQVFKPTIMIGVSTVGGLFSEEVVKTMAALNKRPIIFALSNPTNKAECTAEQAYKWTDGQVLFAAGVQFDKVIYNGQTFYPGQANNFYIYPAMGLAVYATKARLINDEMFIAAASGCAATITEEQRNNGLLYPLQSNIFETEISIATTIVENIFRQNLAATERPANVKDWLYSLVYKPSYLL